MVDWSLAAQIARFAAGSPDAAPIDGLDELAATAAEQVSAYTGLAGPVPAIPPEAVGRAEWAEANLSSLSDLLDPVGERLTERLRSAGPLAGALQAAGGATLAAEVGLVLGYVAQRVLGQYELSLLAADPQPRLLIVAPNIERTADELDLDHGAFLHWIVLHEQTHVLQFSGVPWLHDHIGGLLRRYLATVEVQVKSGAAGALPSLPDPSRIVKAFRGGGLAALVQTKEQRLLNGQMQATMSVVEGYSEHVMDAVGRDVIEQYSGLREAMDRRRSGRSAPQRAIERLLGLDRKLRQYTLGKQFCVAVAERAGIDGLNQVWADPDSLPHKSELSDPDAWMERVGVAAVAVV